MFDPSQLNTAFQFLTAWGAAFTAALWVSLVFWAFRDIRGRTVDPLLRILAVLAVAALFLPGVVVYLVLRPNYTLEEEYQKSLEEEALLQTIESAQHCPGCSRRTDDKWLVCPDCQTRLKKTCHNCRQLMELHWKVCPFCSAPAPVLRKEQASMDKSLPSEPAAEAAERSEIDSLLEDLEGDL